MKSYKKASSLERGKPSRVCRRAEEREREEREERKTRNAAIMADFIAETRVRELDPKKSLKWNICKWITCDGVQVLKISQMIRPYYDAPRLSVYVSPENENMARYRANHRNDFCIASEEPGVFYNLFSKTFGACDIDIITV